MTRLLKRTPLADGYRMPAEFERHAGTWMLWPERLDNWRDGARPAQQAFAAVAEAIRAFEPVSVGVSAAQYEFARSQLDPRRARRGNLQRRCLDARCRAHLRGQRRRPAPGRRLAVQCLGRPGWRAVLSLEPGRPGGAARWRRSKAAIAIARRW